MKVDKKVMARFVLLEAVLIALLVPYVDAFNNFRSQGFRWAFGYLFFFAAVVAAMCIKMASLFFPVWTVCTAVDFVFDKKGSLLIAAVPAAVWVLLNVLEPLNCGALTKNSQKTKALRLNLVFFLVAAAFLVAVILIIHFDKTYVFNGRYYRVPWIALILYYLYSLIAKSSIPLFVKARETLKRITA